MFYLPRKEINHESMRQFIRDNFSQYKWEDIVLENSCGPIPQPIVQNPILPKARTPSLKARTPSPKAKTPSPKAKTPSPKAKTPEEEEQIINPALLTMKPRELKRLVDIIINEIKVKVNQLKDIELTQQQKKLNKEYKDELYWKGLSEHIDASKENELQNEYLQFIPKLINGTTGKPTEFRIVELQQLIWHLENTKTIDYENEHSYSRQVCLVILSNWKKTMSVTTTPPKPPTPINATQRAYTEKRVKHNMTQKQPKKISALQQLKEYVEQGIPYLDNLTEDNLSAMVLKANDAYTNSKPLISDTQYDLLREYIAEKYPNNEAIQRIGAPVNNKNKVRLPYNMPSMDKIKADKGSLDGWSKKFGGPYVVSCKLDGVSGMYSTIGEPKLYTRGDGTIGQDISHLIDLMKLPKHKDVVVRGEFIIAKRAFEERHAATYSNPRNMVAGVINSKTIGKRIKELRDIEFVCYEVIHPVLKPSEQKALLSSIGHKPVYYETADKLSMDYLTNTLTRFKAESEYELDGIIVEDDDIHPRTANNPEHAFAFKMAIDEQTAETRVIDVEWAASQDGYLKPRVKVEQVSIGGVKIQYTTGFNGKFIRDNGIGPGAVIQIIRSGDVIPYIKSVVEPVEPKMPDVDYVWNETGVDIVVADLENDSEVRARNIVGFFSDLGIDGLSTGNVTKIINAGYTSVPAIIKMSKANLLAVPGFQEKMAEKIYTGIRDKLESVKLVELMVASNKFGRGFGLKTIKPVMDAHPDFLTAEVSRDTKIAWLKEAGINKTAPAIVDAIPGFIQFLEECGLTDKLVNANSSEKNFDIANPLYKKSVVMTKVRDQDIIEHLAKVGATLEDTIKKGNTVALIVKSKSDVSNKTKDAEKKGVPIMTVEEFKTIYMG